MAETIHESKFSKKWGRNVPACKTFAMRCPSGAVTEDKSKVNCKLCAKKGDYEPATKPEPQNPTGTCQCCFNAQKVVKGHISLHGYTRPGWGFINGRCRGSGYKPFEVTCEQTKVFKGELEAAKVNAENRKGALERNEVDELVYEKSIRDASMMSGFRTEFVRIAKGTVQSGIKYTKDYTPSFEELRQDNIRDVTYRIEDLTFAIADLGKRIAEWKPVPFPPVK
ncbi:hypothetical protein [Myxococcus phage Mx1]|nr:hypothetical protein [Myxococcus phage Mx1]